MHVFQTEVYHIEKTHTTGSQCSDSRSINLYQQQSGKGRWGGCSIRHDVNWEETTVIPLTGYPSGMWVLAADAVQRARRVLEASARPCHSVADMSQTSLADLA